MRELCMHCEHEKKTDTKVWIQRLKHNLADNTIDKIQIKFYSGTSIESNSLNERASKTCMSPANPPSIPDNPCLRRLGDTAIGNRFCCLQASQCRANHGRHDAGSTGCQDPRLRTQRSRENTTARLQKFLLPRRAAENNFHCHLTTTCNSPQ